MDRDLLNRFLKDFSIITQEDDTEFPYANPSDAARSLIKARNWTGTLTERVIALNDELKTVRKTLHRCESNLALIERQILSRCNPIPSWATKNKEIQKTFALTNAAQEEAEIIGGLESDIIGIKENIITMESEIDQYNLLLKSLDKTTEWIVQYINWMKYEARSLNG